MTKPETKVVLGRRFTRQVYPHFWRCQTTHGLLELHVRGHAIEAILRKGSIEVANELGPTESAAILALQSQLRKMAELEVAE